MKCKACRVTFEGKRYQVAVDGQVFPCELLAPTGTWYLYSAVDSDLAKQIRREASRQRANRNARERNEARRDLGMVKTPYGWE